MLEVFTVKTTLIPHWTGQQGFLLVRFKKDASSRGSLLSLRRPLCHPFYSFPVKQLEIRLTVFVGHSEKKKKSRT